MRRSHHRACAGGGLVRRRGALGEPCSLRPESLRPRDRGRRAVDPQRVRAAARVRERRHGPRSHAYRRPGLLPGPGFLRRARDRQSHQLPRPGSRRPSVFRRAAEAADRAWCRHRLGFRRLDAGAGLGGLRVAARGSADGEGSRPCRPRLPAGGQRPARRHRHGHRHQRPHARGFQDQCRPAKDRGDSRAPRLLGWRYRSHSVP